MYLYIWVFDAFAWCLCFFFLGGVIVIEAKVSQGGAPRVVERWGELDSSKCVLAAVKMTRYVLGVTSCLSLLNFEFQASGVVVGNMFQFFLTVWFWFQL